MPVINEDGCLQEWMENHKPIDTGHHHRSPFVGMCPGDRITSEDTPEYQAAARNLLGVRQNKRDTACAFSCVGDAQILARLYEGDAAFRELSSIARTWLINNLLLSTCDWHENAATLNWFPGRKVFQIEASIGIVASIAEMLFQDRQGLLRLLPALPEAWPKGQIKGLRSRGGFEVDLSWDEGRLVEATTRSLRGERCRVKSFTSAGELEIQCKEQKHPYNYAAGITKFHTQSGEYYVLHPDNRR